MIEDTGKAHLNAFIFSGVQFHELPHLPAPAIHDHDVLARLNANIRTSSI
jgi:hypothetical protein